LVNHNKLNEKEKLTKEKNTMVKHTDTWAEREQKIEQDLERERKREREKEIRNEASEATITKGNYRAAWMEREQELESVARRVVKCIAEQNVAIGEVDRVLAHNKVLVGTMPVSCID
jgi:hypothetical protein